MTNMRSANTTTTHLLMHTTYSHHTLPGVGCLKPEPVETIKSLKIQLLFLLYDYKKYIITQLMTITVTKHFSLYVAKTHGGDTLHLFFIWGNQYVIISNTSSK